MIVSFYKTSDPVEVINKTITGQLTKTGNLIEDCDIIKPSIEFNFNPVGYNYAYVQDFGRYYYIDKIINTGAATWRVDFSVDALMSFKGDIYKSPCIAAKSSSEYNLYLNDPNYKCYQNDVVLMHKFSGGFSGETPCYALSLFGDRVDS